MNNPTTSHDNCSTTYSDQHTATGEKPIAKSPAIDFLVGGLVCLVGIVVTIGTYSAVAKTGGPYVVAWGAILFGGIRCLKGFCALAS